MKKLFSLMVFVGSLFGSVDINHASFGELTSLNGIGDSKAKRIIDYIKQNGCFDSVNQLTNVKGIGKGIINKNKEILIVKPCKK